MYTITLIVTDGVGSTASSSSDVMVVGGGCGCRTAGGRSSSPLSLATLAALMLGLAFVTGRRRRVR